MICKYCMSLIVNMSIYQSIIYAYFLMKYPMTLPPINARKQHDITTSDNNPI